MFLPPQQQLFPAQLKEVRFGPQQGDLRLLGSPSGQSAGGGARTRDRTVAADLRADSLTTEPPELRGEAIHHVGLLDCP
ncbi:hypothetical protein PoB_000614800 [Plakobranchus ocellatus]|uniref:Uncharacterized protein n=1 Tax=Plakobranchus ocellatus TaxID=259542 RepID=A0AAV3YBW3_9GAST|nr:hypothetical protein PoB_000614800 [Plakobranchus ocellatus]